MIDFLGTLSMLDSNIFPGLGHDYLGPEVNMFLLPVQELEEDNLTKAGPCVYIQYNGGETPNIEHRAIQNSTSASILGLGTYPLFSLLPGYKGHPSFSTMVFKLRSQILAMPRCQLSHTILTEKNW